MPRTPKGPLTALLTLALLGAALAGSVGGVRAATGGPPPGTGGNGTLSLSVEPTNAAVTVNGTSVHVDASGTATVSLAPGVYLVQASASGDSSFGGNVTVVVGQTSYLTIHLTPTSPSPAPLAPVTSLPLYVVVAVVGAVVLVVVAVAVARRPATSRPPSPSPARVEAPDDGPE